MLFRSSVHFFWQNFEMAKKKATAKSDETTTMDDLVFDAANVRVHTDKNKQAIRNSVKQFKAGRSILLDADNVIRAGNGTAEAWKEAGGKVRIIESDGSELIAVKRTDLKGAEAMAYAIADNRSSELAEWDDENLAAQLQELESDFDLEELGFDSDDLEEVIPIEEKEGFTDEDEVPEPPKESITKLGDLWILGDHRLLCGDSTNENDLSKLMNGQKAKLSVTSPPYENQREYSTWPSYDDYLEFINKIISNFNLICDSDFTAVWNMGSSESTNNFIPADNYKQFINNGFQWIEWIVWNKESAAWTIPRSQHIEKGKYIPALRWESICVFNKGSRTDFDLKDKDEVRSWLENVWNMNKVIGSQQKKIGHPALFPVELPYRSIKSFSMTGQNVFEPFCGGGSTLIAAEKTGRKCFGMELSPVYCDVIVKRWEEYTGKKAELVRQ